MPGFVFAQGMCTRPTGAHAYLCAPADEAECKTQCDEGSAESCFNLGRILARRSWMDDIGPARPPLVKACTAEIAESCTLLGEALWGMADPEVDAAAADQAINEAYGFLMRGCQGGDGYGCELAGDIMSDHKLPSYDESAAFGLYSRACELGSGVGCSFAADRLFEGKGVAKNLERGLQTLLRSCEAGSVDECAEYGEVLAEGRHGVTKDLKLAAKFMAHACEVDVGWCETAGDIAAKAGDAGLAKQMYRRDCDFDNESEACGKL
jgi:TPR repeat protein